MEVLVLDLESVPCCESHERMWGAVRGTEKGGGADREAGGRGRALGLCLGDKIAACGVGKTGGAGREMALFV